MKHISLVFTALLLATPAIAAECHFENSYGDTLTFKSPLEIAVVGTDWQETCSLAGGGSGSNVRMANCSTYTIELFWVEPSLGAEATVLIFDNTAWHEVCKE